MSNIEVLFVTSFLCSLESEDGSVEFETPTDDEEVMIPSQDKNKKVPDIPNSDIRDEQTLSNTQQEDWLLPTEPMHGARPRQTGRERPPVIEIQHLGMLRDFPVVARTADFRGKRRYSHRRGGAVRPPSLRVYHVRYELYLNLFRMVFRRTGYEMTVRTLGRRWIC